MSQETIDRLARAIAARGTRRRFLAAAAATAGTLVAGDKHASAGGQCLTNDDCIPEFTCQNGFCLAPPCTEAGVPCSSHAECCEGMTCTTGVCGVSPRCGRLEEDCGAGCCPGLICSAGMCIPEPPPPPENSGNPGSNPGGNNNGGGNSGGGSSTGGGTTSGGVTVSSLPSTGTSHQSASARMAILASTAIAATLGAVARRIRLPDGADPSRD